MLAGGLGLLSASFQPTTSMNSAMCLEWNVNTFELTSQWCCELISLADTPSQEALVSFNIFMLFIIQESWLAIEEILIVISFVFCSLCWHRTLTGLVLACCSFLKTTTLSSSTTTGSPALCVIRRPRTPLCALCVEHSSVSKASAANSKGSVSVSW